MIDLVEPLLHTPVKKRNCFVLVSDGFFDWEAALVTAALNRFTDFTVQTFSTNGRPVRSLANVRVMPDLPMSSVTARGLDLLVLPGGIKWTNGGLRQTLPLIEAAVHGNKCVAAICTATAFLAEHGFLNTIRHTSNHIAYLKHVPGYQGEDWYVNRPCVTEGNIITASGTATLPFALAVMDYFGLPGGNDALNTWFRHFQKAAALPGG